MNRLRVLSLALLAAAQAVPLLSQSAPGAAAEPVEHVVTTLADDGAGSLRRALAAAAASPGPDRIVFERSLIADPATIRLARELPPVQGDVTIDGAVADRLWVACGVTLSGAEHFRVLAVAPGGRLTLRSLTVADGRARDGGGILVEGGLVVEGVTFRDNEADLDGGAVASLGGDLYLANATFARNRAGGAGGALAALDGCATIVHATIADNAAPRGGGLFSTARLALRNSLLARNEGGDCVATGELAAPPGRNFLGAAEGCGPALATGDPKLQDLGYFNGPLETYPLSGGSAAINLGDPADAVDAGGNSLYWDARGNGDPRHVAGFPDLGAFEQQAFPDLTVDTAEDTPLRACTRSAPGDCPLRGALELALADPRHPAVRFDPAVFARPTVLRLSAPLPVLTHPLTLDASGTGGVILVAEGDFPPLPASPGVEPRLLGVTMEKKPPRAESPGR